MRLGNSFEQVLGPRTKDFRSLRERLLAAGVSEARMTGSGSAVFGVLESATPTRAVAGRFVGSETLYGVRSMRSGLRLVRVP